MIEILGWVVIAVIAFLFPFLVLLQVFLLLGLLGMVVARFLPQPGGHNGRRWLVPIISLGFVSGLAGLLTTFPAVGADVLSGVFAFLVNTPGLFYLNAVTPIFLLALISWRIRPLVPRRVLTTYLCCSFLFAGAGYGASLYYFYQLPRFESTLVRAFNGHVELGSDPRYKFFCTGFECAETLPRLPSVSPIDGVHCTQSIMSGDLRAYGHDVNIGGLGACCIVDFGELGGSEVHVYWTGARYEVLLTEPRMRRILEALAERDGTFRSRTAVDQNESRL